MLNCMGKDDFYLSDPSLARTWRMLREEHIPVPKMLLDKVIAAFVNAEPVGGGISKKSKPLLQIAFYRD